MSKNVSKSTEITEEWVTVPTDLKYLGSPLFQSNHKTVKFK